MLAENHNLTAISPLDSEVDIQAPEILERIFRINVQDIVEAQVIVANCEAFRGACVDDGTAFEIGYASAKGKSIVLYTPTADVPLRERIAADFSNPERAAYFQKDKFPRSEDFPGGRDRAGPVNLMLTEACRASPGGAIFKTYEECLFYLAQSDCPCFQQQETQPPPQKVQLVGVSEHNTPLGSAPVSPLDVNATTNAGL